MVRFENEPLPAKPKGGYKYDQTYLNSYWDAVLEGGNKNNDRSFEKPRVDDLKKHQPPVVKKMAAVEEGVAQVTEEKKCAEAEDEASIPSSIPSKVDDDVVNVTSSAADNTATGGAASSLNRENENSGLEVQEQEEEKEEDQDQEEEELADYAQQSPRQYEAPELPAEEEPETISLEVEKVKEDNSKPQEVALDEEEVAPDEDDGVTEETHPLDKQAKADDESPKAEETEVPPEEEGDRPEEEYPLDEQAKVEDEKPQADEQVEADDDESPEVKAPLVEQIKAAGKASPEKISQLMVQMVSEAAKKELESRLQQQKQQQKQQEQEQKEEEQEHDQEYEEEAEELAQLKLEPVDLPALVEGAPMDAESLAKAQAKLMEQAKSLAKAQALIQAQAKALARMGQQQQKKASPSIAPTRTPKSPPRASPNHPKPDSIRAPSDEFLTKSATKSTAPMTPPSPERFESMMQRMVSEMSQSGNSEPTALTRNTSTNTIPHHPPLKALTVLDGEWLSQAKSEAQAKAQALIRTAQAEAAARAQARKEAKERTEAEERARLKAETEAQIKAKAVRDAWHFEQTQAAFKAEERLRAKTKAAAKAAAEEKMRRKADTDAATHNVMDAQRAQMKAEAEYKLRRKADMDARWLAECKARRTAETKACQEAMEKAKAVKEEKANQANMEAERQKKIQIMAAAQAKANAEHQRRLRAQAMEKVSVEIERQAAQAKSEAEREKILKEMAAAQAKANAEHKLRLKAQADAKWLAECQTRRAAEAKARETAMAEAKAEAKVRAKMARAGELPLPANNSPQSIVAAKKLLQEAHKEFVPFGKSKGEEVEDGITLFLQVPGVVHVSEVKVELEDGVLYISRGIILDGVEGVQKYTRSFPFEEQLLDTHRISITFIPAIVTADGVSVLQFTLPKVQSTWKIPMSLAEPATEEEAQTSDDCNDLTEISLDAPDDEVSLTHPSDELHLQACKTTDVGKGDEVVAVDGAVEKSADNDATRSAANESSHSIQNKNSYRILSMNVPTGLALEDISSTYDEDSVRVVGNEGPRLSFRYVAPMNSQQVEVRELEGSYDPENGLLRIKGPLKRDYSVSKPKSRRIKVTKMEEGHVHDTCGMISLFNDDVSISSKEGSHSHQNSPNHKKKHGINLKSIASKYLRLKPKKHKHEVP